MTVNIQIKSYGYRNEGEYMGSINGEPQIVILIDRQVIGIISFNSILQIYVLCWTKLFRDIQNWIEPIIVLPKYTQYKYGSNID